MLTIALFFSLWAGLECVSKCHQFGRPWNCFQGSPPKHSAEAHRIEHGWLKTPFFLMVTISPAPSIEWSFYPRVQTVDLAPLPASITPYVPHEICTDTISPKIVSARPDKSNLFGKGQQVQENNCWWTMQVHKCHILGLPLMPPVIPCAIIPNGVRHLEKLRPSVSPRALNNANGLIILW